MSDSESAAILRRIWETAFDRGEIRLRYASHKEANDFRLRLYAAVSKFRKNPALDLELEAKLSKMECVIEGKKDDGNPAFVIIRLSHLNPLIKQAADQLDLLINPTADDAADSLRRIQESLSYPEEEGSEE
jgi:hypothetical protein